MPLESLTFFSSSSSSFQSRFLSIVNQFLCRNDRYPPCDCRGIGVGVCWKQFQLNFVEISKKHKKKNKNEEKIATRGCDSQLDRWFKDPWTETGINWPWIFLRHQKTNNKWCIAITMEIDIEIFCKFFFPKLFKKVLWKWIYSVWIVLCFISIHEIWQKKVF